MAKRGRKPLGIYNKTIHERLVILWQVGFFSHTPLMAKRVGKTISALRKYLGGVNKTPFSIIEKYKLESDEFWELLDKVKQDTFREIDFTKKYPELEPYKEEIFASILWYSKKKCNYRLTKVINDHIRWYQNFIKLMSLAKKGLSPQAIEQQSLYDFRKHTNKNIENLSPQKKKRWIEYQKLLKEKGI